jgi:oxygen-independent coproporphyrinogen-3 oxidase
MYELADARLARAGYAWYEISNWARPGHASRHNLGYWENRAWEAVGPGAHAFDGRTRRWNAAHLDGYLTALGASPAQLPPGGSEQLDDAAFQAEAGILALRTAAGTGTRGLPTTTRVWLEERLQPSTAAGLAERLDDGAIRLTLRGRLLSNEVFADLLPVVATPAGAR